MRYKLTLSYRGTNYHGWQQQPVLSNFTGIRPPPGRGIPTIQEILARAMGKVIGHPVVVVASSRTDAGVHAKGQIVHFDSDQEQIPVENLRRATNHQLPRDILVRKIEPAADDFNAILSATSKRYQYYIWNNFDRDPFTPDLAWFKWQALDVPAMQKAAARFEGEHDFASFARPGHKRVTTVRTIYQCIVSKRGPRIVFGVAGNGFLWNMVRIMVGTLVEVGTGRFTADDISLMLEKRDRRAAGLTAPPEGLYLQWIKFAEYGTPGIADEVE